jgi:hypothetical protein
LGDYQSFRVLFRKKDLLVFISLLSARVAHNSRGETLLRATVYTLSHDQRADVTPLCAQGKPDTYFMRALADVVRDQAHDARRRQR